MLISRKAWLGSLAVVFTYVFWFAYVYVLQNDLFFFHPWIDIPFHIAGGFVVGIFISFLLLFCDQIKGLWMQSYWTMWGVLMIGVAWEYYEYIFKVYDMRANILVDTIADLANDFIGGLISLLVVYLVYKITERPKIHE